MKKTKSKIKLLPFDAARYLTGDAAHARGMGWNLNDAIATVQL